MLCDTGPLVALIDRGDDPSHDRCQAVLARLPALALVTTWPCFTEAMHLLRRVGGSVAQDALWGLCARGSLALHDLGPEDRDRMRALMRRYADTPMDLADASLVSAAETSGHHRVFTLDRHFHAYRIHGKIAFEVLPDTS